MWGGDLGHCLIAVKGSLQFLCCRVTFRSVHTPHNHIKRYSLCEHVCERDRVLYHLAPAVCLPGKPSWIPQRRWILGPQVRREAGAVSRDTRKEEWGIRTSSSICSPALSVGLKMDRWMERERLALISSQRAAVRRNEWGKIRGVGWENEIGLLSTETFSISQAMLESRLNTLHLCCLQQTSLSPVMLRVELQLCVLREQMTKSHLVFDSVFPYTHMDTIWDMICYDMMWYNLFVTQQNWSWTWIQHSLKE